MTLHLNAMKLSIELCLKFIGMKKNIGELSSALRVYCKTP